MKQVFNVKGQAVVRDVPPPQCGRREVLVKVLFSAVSVGTELKSIAPGKSGLVKKVLQRKDLVNLALKKAQREGVVKTYKFAKSMLSSWWTLGYSCVGRIVEIGQDVSEWRVDDVVACAGLGQANHADYVCVAQTMVAKVPSSVALEEASFSTLGAIVIHALHRAEVSFGQIVVVYGMGLLGNIMSRVLHAAGCQVIGIDINPERLTKSRLHKSFSDHPVEGVLDYTKRKGADAVIITATDPESVVVNNSLQMCRRKGKVVVVGRVGLNIDRQPFYDKEIDLLISRAYGPGRHEPMYEEKGIDLPYEYVRWTVQRNMDEFLRLLDEKKINVQDLIEARFPIEQAAEAYKALQHEGTKPLSVVLTYKDTLSVTEEKTIILSPELKPKDKYGVAIIGGGNFARDVHIPLLKENQHFFVKTILTKNGYTAMKVAQEYSIPHVAPSYDTVLHDPEIDVVVITTPHSTHCDYAVKAINAGKHVFVEKPLAMNRKENDLIRKALVHHPVVFTVGFNRSFSPLSYDAKKLFTMRKHPLVIQYRMQTVVNVNKPWLYDPDIGGGRIIGELCHVFDFLLWFTDAEIVSLQAYAVKTPDPAQVADHHLVIAVSFSDGSVASIVYSEDGTSLVNKERIEVIGEGTVAVIDDFTSLEVNGKKQSSKLEKGFTEHYGEFLKALRGERNNLIAIDRAIAVMDACFKVVETIHGQQTTKKKHGTKE